PELGGDGRPQGLLIRAGREAGVDPVVELHRDMVGRVRSARRGQREQGKRGKANEETRRSGHGGPKIAEAGDAGGSSLRPGLSRNVAVAWRGGWHRPCFWSKRGSCASHDAARSEKESSHRP